MQSLHKQLLFELDRFKVKKLDSIFIGGGTPSTIDSKLYYPIFKTLQPYIKIDTEITTEANPNSSTISWIEGMKNLGVNRISFGVQSFDTKKLKHLGRSHNYKDAIDSVLYADKLGIKNISIDLIYGTKFDSISLLDKDLNIAFNLPINHLSAYSLTIEENTLFEKSPSMAKDDLELTNWIIENINKKLPQYEISNFGIYQSIHNKGYWQLKNYLGIGAGAVGFLDNKRFYPIIDIKTYIQNPLKHTTENLSTKDIFLEKLFLGLRSNIGVNKNILTTIQQQDKVEVLIKENKIIQNGNFLFNTNYLIADEIALFLSD